MYNSSNINRVSAQLREMTTTTAYNCRQTSIIHPLKSASNVMQVLQLSQRKMQEQTMSRTHQRRTPICGNERVEDGVNDQNVIITLQPILFLHKENFVSIPLSQRDVSTGPMVIWKQSMMNSSHLAFHNLNCRSRHLHQTHPIPTCQLAPRQRT